MFVIEYMNVHLNIYIKHIYKIYSLKLIDVSINI